MDKQSPENNRHIVDEVYPVYGLGFTGTRFITSEQIRKASEAQDRYEERNKKPPKPPNRPNIPLGRLATESI